LTFGAETDREWPVEDRREGPLGPISRPSGDYLPWTPVPTIRSWHRIAVSTGARVVGAQGTSSAQEKHPSRGAIARAGDVEWGR